MNDGAKQVFNFKWWVMSDEWQKLSDKWWVMKNKNPNKA